MSAAPETLLADGFAQHVQAWARGAGAPHDDCLLAAAAARAASLATSAGHVCAMLGEVAAEAGRDPAQARSALLASGVVGDAANPGVVPLVLDDDGRLYLHRYFDYERRLAQRLVQAASRAPKEASKSVADRLATLFGASGEADWQQLAAALALRQGLVVVSGGPGTGKTTTVVNLLACLLEQEPASRIVLAAPTGKAAARMTEAIRLRADHLPAALRAKLPTESFTIHRLLRYHPQNGFRHHAQNPLPVDVLVVDEASMLDLALATRLLEAVPPHARIVLLGDKDQLAAVEAGAVFAELSADPTLTDACRTALETTCRIAPFSIEPPAPVHVSALQDATVWLTRNYRFAADSGIGRLAGAIQRGDAPGALEWLRTSADDAVTWHPGTQAAFELAAAGYHDYFDAVRESPRDPARAHAAFAGFRVLCAVRGSDEGVDAMNEVLTQHARTELAAVLGEQGEGYSADWFAGRPVMVLVNDYALKLFNGDIGIALPDAEGRLMVYFPDGDNGWRAVAPARMPRHETAFAMTVHKSQGSEFSDVMVLLPAHETRAATRELLYTAVTRAKERVVLCAPESTLAASIRTQAVRRSGLLARLREQARGT